VDKPVPDFLKPKDPNLFEKIKRGAREFFGLPPEVKIQDGQVRSFLKSLKTLGDVAEPFAPEINPHRLILNPTSGYASIPKFFSDEIVIGPGASPTQQIVDPDPSNDRFIIGAEVGAWMTHASRTVQLALRSVDGGSGASTGLGMVTLHDDGCGAHVFAVNDKRPYYVPAGSSLFIFMTNTDPAQSATVYYGVWLVTVKGSDKNT
jgi:hypothetical protein